MFEISNFSKSESDILQTINNYEKNDIICNKTIIEKTLGIFYTDNSFDRYKIFIKHIVDNNKIINKPRIHFGSPFVCLKDIDTDNIVNCNLIITNDKILEKWENILKFNKDSLIIKSKSNLSDVNFSKILISVCSSTTYKYIYDDYKNIRWNRIIVDIPETLNLNSHISWNCNFVWLLTFEPDMLFYSDKDFLKPVSKINDYQLFKQLIIKKNKINDNIKIQNILCYNENKLDKVDTLIELLKTKNYNKIGSLFETCCNNKPKQCVICYENKLNYLSFDCCGQIHCTSCFIKLLENDDRCAYCRSQINVNKLKLNLVNVKKDINTYLTKEQWIFNFIKTNLDGNLFLCKTNFWINHFKINYPEFIIKKNKTNTNYLIDFSKNLNQCDLSNINNVVWLDDSNKKEEKIIYNLLGNTTNIISYKLNYI